MQFERIICIQFAHAAHSREKLLKNRKIMLDISRADCYNSSCSQALHKNNMERWLSWSKAHDWKSCRAPKALKGSNPFLSAMLKATSGFGCSLFLVFADAAVTQNRMPCAGLFSPAHGIRFCFSLHFLTAGEFLLTFLVYCSRL